MCLLIYQQSALDLHLTGEMCLYRRIANRDSAQHAKVRNRKELAEACTEVGELLADNVALEDRVTELFDMHKQSCREAAHYKHWFNMAMRSNNDLADRLRAYDATMQVRWCLCCSDRVASWAFVW